MANTIKIKAGNGTPTTSDIVDKELAFDRDANKLYINDNGTIVDLSGSASLDTEAVQDIVGAMFSSNTETRISATYQDGDGTIDLVVDDMTADTNTQLSNEQVQDIVGGMFSSNTETRITATYQDGDGTVDLVVDNDLSNYDNSSSGFLTAHPNISAASTSNNSGRTYIQDITLDSNGHVTGIATATESVTDTNLSTEEVQDIVGAMFSGNTETRITATYQDSDGTIDLVVDDLDTDTQLTTENVQDIVGAMFSSNTETRISATYQDGDGTIDLVVDDMTANDNTVTTNIAGTGIDVSSGTGNSTISVDVSDFMSNGSNNRIVTATGTDAMNAEANLTFNGHLLTVSGDNANGINMDADGSTTSNSERIFFTGTSTSAIFQSGSVLSFRTGATAGSSSGTERMHIDTSGIDVNGSVIADSLDISGDVDIDGTMEADAITVNGTTLNEHIQDTVGAMFSSNTETRISATYQDGDGTIDLVVDDMTTDTNTNQLTTFTLTADSGSNQTIAHGNTLDIAGGTNITTSVGATDTVTINVDDAFLKNDADDTTSGTITAGGFTTSGTLKVDDIHGNSNDNNRLILDDDSNSGLANGVSLTGANTIYLACDETNNGTGEIKFLKGTDNDLDSGTSVELAKFDNSGNLSFRTDSNSQTRYIHLPRGGGITFYGDTSQHHGIFSRDDSNSVADDLLISSYGAVYIDLDSNDNNSAHANFEIGKHNTASDPLFMVDGETGHVGINEDSLDADLHITGSPVVVKLERAGQRAIRFGVPDNSTNFVFADADDLKSNQRMVIDNSGLVGIGETSPISKLHVEDASNISMASTGVGQMSVEGDGYTLGIALDGNGAHIYHNSSSRFLSLGTNETEQARLTTGGAWHVVNDVVAFSSTPSDKRLKTNVKDIDYGLDTIMKLKPKQYDWKKDDRHDIGFIAQEVEEVIPEIVKDNEWFDDKVKTLDYEKLTAVLIKAVQELKTEIEELKK